MLLVLSALFSKTLVCMSHNTLEANYRYIYIIAYAMQECMTYCMTND